MKKIFLSLLLTLHAAACAQENPAKTTIHFRAYLAPSIPKELYQLIADYINRTTSLDIVLSFECMYSGPPRSFRDPFAAHKIDIAHICSPSFIWLTSRKNPSIELLTIAPIFKDERACGKPIYFSDVIVTADSPIKNFKEFQAKRWCYNDTESLSGYFCLLQKLTEIKQPTSFFSKLYGSGNHLNSIELIINGVVDGSAIDSNVLALQLKNDPTLQQKIKVIESWGPFPIQPLVVRKDLPDNIKKIFINALLQMAVDEKDALAEYLIDGFGPIADENFEGARKLLYECEQHILNNISE
jgi:phosphonate transport system substrate-binding protein